jgi:hypothetical protein
MTTTLARRTEMTTPPTIAPLGIALIALLLSAVSVSMSTGSAADTSSAQATATLSATLTDSAASRELAEMLPATLELDDAWGQAKTVRLPHPLPTEGAARVMRPVVGGVYYWPGTQTLAVYYDDLGHRVPPPGLVPLGVVDTGVDAIVDAGQVTVHLESAA